MYYVYCARRVKINVMLRKNVSLEVQFLPSSTLRNRVKVTPRHRLQWCTVRPNGPALRLQEAFQTLLLLRNRMGRCVAQPTAHSIPKNGVPSAMVPCEFCMLRASAIAARAPVVWKDWPRCSIRRAWLRVIRSQTVCLKSSPQPEPLPVTKPSEGILTRAQRARWRLSWEQRLARNARPSDAPWLCVTLHGLPATFAHAFDFELLTAA